MITDTRRDEYRRKGGPIGETYYQLATNLTAWEQGHSIRSKREIAGLRSKLAKARKAIDAAEKAVKAAHAFVHGDAS